MMHRIRRVSPNAFAATARIPAPTATPGDGQRRAVRCFASAFVGTGSCSGDMGRPPRAHAVHARTRAFGSQPTAQENRQGRGIRLSSLLCQHLGLSRRQSERMILTERVTLFGKTIVSPAFELRPSTNPSQNSSTAMKVDGKLVKDMEKTLKRMHAEREDDAAAADPDVAGKPKKTENSGVRVWLANKLKGELITEDDPAGRPSMVQRLTRGGVGKSVTKNGIKVPLHLKPIGRLDMMTEGLMVFTNDGKYAREMELPTNRLWRTYRARVHGRLTEGKLRAMRQGPTVRVNDAAATDDRNPSGEVVRTGKLMKYKGVKVAIERKNLARGRRGGERDGRGTNTWLRITCAEGKNRQLRRILDALGLDVTRLIRVAYGDYDLNTIPPGLAIEVPAKSLEGMAKSGRLFPKKDGKRVGKEQGTGAVQWVN